MTKMTKEYDLILLDSGFCSIRKDNKSSIDVFEIEDGNWGLSDNQDDIVGHGTSVMSIISNNYRGNYAVFKAFEKESQSNLDLIKFALKYISNNLTCRYIQMSFGIRGYDKELEDICRQLYNEGIIIIAAYDNYGAISYPAAFHFVIGVSGDVYCKTKNDFKVCYNGLVDIFAKSGSQIVAHNNEKGFNIKQGNSYAASYVSLKLLQSNLKYNSKSDAMRCFDSKYKLNVKESECKVLHSRVALFPVNKEMYSVINYADMLKVDLVDVYDVKYSANLNNTLKNFNGDRAFTVRNIEKCNWDNFDTMIIGHLRELSLLLQKDLKKELLQFCLDNKKNVYCFDSIWFDEFREEFKSRNLILESADDYEKTLTFGKLYQIKTPVLAVVGTSKKQGKFTLQMQIRRLMESRGVNLGQLGTEPNSLLLGCDEMVPLGYDCKISSQPGRYIIEVLNEKMHRVDKKEYDLILVGGQSGFLPQVTLNSNYININQMSFLYGTLPDGVILSISYSDNVEYIRKSIMAIESLLNAKVILLALYAYHTVEDYVLNINKRLLTKDEVQAHKKMLYDELGLNMIVSGDFSFDDELFEGIIKYYCED